MLDYDVSLHILVVLVVAISTSPRTSKTESGCKSYDRFRTGGFAVFPSSGSTGAGTAGNPFGLYLAVVPVVSPVVPLPGSVFQSVWCSNSPGGGSTGGFTGSTAPACFCPQRLDISPIDSREINAVLPRMEASRPLKWSEHKISFDAPDHPKSTRTVGTIPLVCTHTINNIAITNTLLDGGVITPKSRGSL